MRDAMNFRRTRRTTGVLLFLLLIWPTGGSPFAQQLGTSALNGSVTDPVGAVLPGAKVTLTSIATHFTRSVTTNNAGLYAFSALTPGAYSLVVNAQGFQTSSLPNIQLFVGQTMVQDVHLGVGSATQQVTVSATAPLLTQSSGEVGTVIEQKTISEMPLNGRSFLQLNLLAPGVTRSKNSNTFDAVQIDPTV